MAQFTVHRNKDARTKGIFPYLVDVQSDLLEDLHTRVVIPMSKLASLTRKPVSQLMPTLEFEGETYVLMTSELAGIARSDLGPSAGSLVERRDAIIGAMDFLLTGF